MIKLNLNRTDNKVIKNFYANLDRNYALLQPAVIDDDLEIIVKDKDCEYIKITRENTGMILKKNYNSENALLCCNLELNEFKTDYKIKECFISEDLCRKYFYLCDSNLDYFLTLISMKKTECRQDLNHIALPVYRKKSLILNSDKDLKNYSYIDFRHNNFMEISDHIPYFSEFQTFIEEFPIRNFYIYADSKISNLILKFNLDAKYLCVYAKEFHGNSYYLLDEASGRYFDLLGNCPETGEYHNILTVAEAALEYLFFYFYNKDTEIISSKNCYKISDKYGCRISIYTEIDIKNKFKFISDKNNNIIRLSF